MQALEPKPKERVLFDANSHLAQITAVVQTYNAAEGLDRTLASIRDEVDRILVLDGYFDMGNSYHSRAQKTSDHSTDNSEQVARKWKAEWVPADRPYRKQWDKMNRVTELVKPDEWVFFIDTDEVLVCYVHNALRQIAGWFSPHSDAFPLKIDEPYFSHPMTGNLGRHRYYCRLLKVKEGMRWVDEANIIYPGRVSLYMGTTPNFCFVRHLRKDLA